MDKVFNFLIVDDDHQVRQILVEVLGLLRSNVDIATNGQEALNLLDKTNYDLIIIDYNMPDMTGPQLGANIRCRLGDKVLILMLTGRGDKESIVTGLDCGADDYILKPFSVDILLARIRALLRRGHQNIKLDASSEEDDKKDLLSFGPLEIDCSKHIANCDNHSLILTLTEFRLLKSLMEQPEHVLTRKELIKEIFGQEFQVSERIIDNHLVGLRKKLGHYQDMIETVRGLGYRIKLLE